MATTQHTGISEKRVHALWEKIGGTQNVDKFLVGQFALTNNIVDCAILPEKPRNWDVLQHVHPIRSVQCDKDHLSLLHVSAKDASTLGALRLLEKFKKTQPIVGAAVHDHLFRFRELFPETWRGKVIAFPATVFTQMSVAVSREEEGMHGDTHQELAIRTLFHDGEELSSRLWRDGRFIPSDLYLVLGRPLRSL